MVCSQRSDLVLSTDLYVVRTDTQCMLLALKAGNVVMQCRQLVLKTNTFAKIYMIKKIST